MTEAWQPSPACPLWPPLQSTSVHFVPLQSVCNMATRGAFFKHRSGYILQPLPENTEHPSVVAHKPSAPAPVSPFSLISHRAWASCVLEPLLLVNAQEFVGSWKLTMIGVFTPEKSTNVKNQFPPPPELVDQHTADSRPACSSVTGALPVLFLCPEHSSSFFGALA